MYYIVIQAPADLRKLNQKQAEERMESYQKYEKALENFQTKLEGLQTKQEKHVSKCK
jgi:hypothetical protein